MFKFIYITLFFLLVSFNGFAKSNLLDFISQKQEFSIFYKLIEIANYQELFNKKTKSELY